jgi:hypothetical protein
VLPIILCARNFLAGELTSGQVMQAASAFTIVQTGFNWLVDNYPRLVDWAAWARRVASLMGINRCAGAGENRRRRKPGPAYAAGLQGAVADHTDQRRTSSRAWVLSQPEGRSGATVRRDAARQRYSSGTGARSAGIAFTLVAMVDDKKADLGPMKELSAPQTS